MDYIELLTEKPQFLSLIPAITFGYLFHLSGRFSFLIWALFLILPAGAAIQANDRGYDIEQTSSTFLNIVLYLSISSFILSFLVGPAFLLMESSPSDLLTAGLVFINLGFVVYVYSDKAVEIFGNIPED